MKRRRFLSMLGAAVAAPMVPALPAAAPLAAPSVAVNQYTYGLAALHARIEPGLALGDMAARFNLSAAQTEAIAQRMVREGFATRHGGMVRAKRMFVQSRGFGTSADRARRLRRDASADRPAQSHRNAMGADTLIGHLHRMCETYGLPLSSRARTSGAMV